MNALLLFGAAYTCIGAWIYFVLNKTEAYKGLVFAEDRRRVVATAWGIVMFLKLTRWITMQFAVTARSYYRVTLVDVVGIDASKLLPLSKTDPDLALAAPKDEFDRAAHQELEEFLNEGKIKPKAQPLKVEVNSLRA